jgi:iron-sulfur cluster repair protein YtfE (RIC family)
MYRSKIGQFFKDTFKKDDSDTTVKSGEIIHFIFGRYSHKEREELMNYIDDFIVKEFNINLCMFG